jgi:hypothetical protein
MTYRPYPNPDRARRQLDRHDDERAPLSDGSSGTSSLVLPRIVISDEAREAMGARLAEVGRSLRTAFQPRPVSSEETTG